MDDNNNDDLPERVCEEDQLRMMREFVQMAMKFAFYPGDRKIPFDWINAIAVLDEINARTAKDWFENPLEAETPPGPRLATKNANPKPVERPSDDDDLI